MADEQKPVADSADEILKRIQASKEGVSPKGSGEDPATSGRVPFTDWLKHAAATSARVGGQYAGNLVGGGIATMLAPETLGGSALLAPALVAGGGGIGAGLGEWAAEKLEPHMDGSPNETSPGRIALATGMGAIPGSWLFNASKPVSSAVRGAALGYVGTAGHKLVDGEGLEKSVDPRGWGLSDWLTGPAMGGAMGYGLSKFEGMVRGDSKPSTAPPKPAPPKEPWIVRDVRNKVVPNDTLGEYKSHQVPSGVLNVGKVPAGSTVEQNQVKENLVKATETAFNQKVKPAAKQAIAETRKSLADSIRDTRPSAPSGQAPVITASIKPDPINTVIQGTEPGSRFTSADPTLAGPEEIIPDANGLVASASPEAPSEATQAALNKPLNKKIDTTQLSQERAGAKSALTKEAAAELQDTKGGIKAADDLDKQTVDLNEAAEKASAKRTKDALKVFEQRKTQLQKQFDRASNAVDKRDAAHALLENEAQIENAKAGMDKRIVVRRVVKDANGQSKIETWSPADPEDTGSGGSGGDGGVDPDVDPYPTDPQRFRVMDKANRWIDRNGGRDVWNFPIRHPNTGDIIVTRVEDGQYPGDIVGDRLPAESAAPVDPQKAIVSQRGNAKNAAQALRRARPFAQLSQAEQQGLVPYLQEAIDQGFTGDLDVAADELAHNYNRIKEGRATAKAAGADSDELIKFVRKNGGINLSREGGGGFSGELKALRDRFKSVFSNRSGKGLVNNKTGLSVDKMLEALKKNDAGMFPQIDAADPGTLFKALHKAAGSEHGTSALEEFNAPSNWWHHIQPEGSPISSVPDVEATDYTGGESPTTVEAPVPSGKGAKLSDSNSGTDKLDELVNAIHGKDKLPVIASGQGTLPVEPNLPGVAGPGGGTPKPLTELPFNLKGGDANPVVPVKPVEGNLFGAAPIRELPKPTVSDEPMSQELSDAIETAAAKEKLEPRPDPKGRRRAKPAWAKAKQGSIDAENQATLAELEATTDPTEKATLLDKLKKEGGGIDPMLLARLGLGLGGAAVGAAVNPDDRMSGALIGGAAGAMLPSAARALPNVDWKALGKRLPDIQRFNYLSDPNGLIANTVAAPIGLATTTAIEKMLQFDPRGFALLKQIPTLGRRWKASLGEAGNSLGGLNVAEQDMPWSRATTKFDKVIAAPAQSITSAHMGLRDAAMKAGFPEEEAVEMALGNEPIAGTGNARLRSLGQGWQSLKSPQGLKIGDSKVKIPNELGNLMAPFTRTASNVLAATPTRTPGLGFLAKAMGQDISWPELLAQQTTGTGVVGVAYMLGANVPPDNARFVRKWVRNLGGRYGLVATAAFEAGQASQTGDSNASAVLKALEGGFPMPTGEVVKDWGNAIGDLVNGEPKLPRSAVPTILQQREDGSGGPIPYDWLSTASR